MSGIESSLPSKVDTLILGGGIIGSSLAWALAERGAQDVVVIDLDLSGIYASSELNAGGARATWWQPVNIETCRETLDFFAANDSEFGFRDLGYLWLYDDPALWQQALEHRTLQNRFGLEIEALDPGEIAERFPIFDREMESIVGATLSPRDGLVNPNAVRARYRREAESLGVRFFNRHYVTGVGTARVSGSGGSMRRVATVDAVEIADLDALDRDGVLRRILTEHHLARSLPQSDQRIECGTVVNCLGAWSPIFSAKIGVPDMTEPVRRQISLVDVHAQDRAADVDFDDLGMIVDPSGLYFHPEGPHVLAGYSTPNEVSGFDFEYEGASFFETEIWPRLAHRATTFERCGHVRGWAGLYAVTPDCSGIADRVAGFANLFEAHSFTGRGVMQSYAVGRGMASLIVDGAYDAIDLSPLTRTRFGDPARWVREELHI